MSYINRNFAERSSEVSHLLVLPKHKCLLSPKSDK